MTVSEFVSEARSLHAAQNYDYSEVEFQTIKDKVKINCSTHGPFYQRVDSHLSGAKCKQCSMESKRITVDEFIARAKNVHSEFNYDYSMVEIKARASNVKIICPVHGVFSQRIDAHLAGAKCKYCAFELQAKRQSSNKDEFIKKAKLVHKNSMYSYEFVEYKTARVKVVITCKEHGNFLQSPDSHLRGHGCPSCSADSNSERLIKSPIGWSVRNWEKSANISKRFSGFKCYLVLFGDIDTGEYFIKIGRTYTDIDRRFKFAPFNYHVLRVFESDAKHIFDMELSMHRHLKEFKVNPSRRFNGQNECFSIDCAELAINIFDGNVADAASVASGSLKKD